MTTPNFEWTCYHCGGRCGGKLESGYGALTGEFTPTGRSTHRVTRTTRANSPTAIDA